MANLEAWAHLVRRMGYNYSGNKTKVYEYKDIAVISAFRNELTNIHDNDSILKMYYDKGTDSYDIEGITKYLKEKDNVLIDKELTVGCDENGKRVIKSVDNYSLLENLKRSKELRTSLEELGFCVVPIKGSFIENCKQDGTAELNENSYFVVYLKDDSNFLKNIKKLSEYYNQDAVLIKAAYEKNCFLLGTNKSQIGYNKLAKRDKLKIHANAELYNIIKQQYNNSLVVKRENCKPFRKNDKRAMKYFYGELSSYKIYGIRCRMEMDKPNPTLEAIRKNHRWDFVKDLQNNVKLSAELDFLYKKFVYKDYKDFKERVNDVNPQGNGVTKAFLDKYYKGDIEQWIKENKTNSNCFNCKRCEYCEDCIECFRCFNCCECRYCELCNACGYCVNCKDCENCRKCENSESCNSCFGAKKLNNTIHSVECGTLLFRNEEEYIKYLYKENLRFTGNFENGCSYEFLLKHNITLEEYSEMNKSNFACWNCWECEYCDTSADLENCNNCSDCYGCKDCENCDGCEDSEDCIDCIDCDNCKNCKYCLGEQDFENKKHDVIEDDIDTKIFKNAEEFIKYLKENGEICNGCTQEFLNEHNITLEEYSKKNTSNKRCWNCWECNKCYDCWNCSNCEGCFNCWNCINCKSCVECIGCDGYDNKYFCSITKTKIFKDLNEYKDYCKNNIYDFTNGCTQEFLDEYKISLEDYIARNETNHNCWNCWECIKCENCNNCNDCLDCKNCIDCTECFGCKKCIKCTECIDKCINCENCTNCSECMTCKECEWCEKCTNCNTCKNCNNCECCNNSRNCNWSYKCSNCTNCKYCEECENCDNCVSCRRDNDCKNVDKL